MPNNQFLEQLQEQASKQAVLNQQRFIPKELDTITSLIGNYPWQTIIFLALVSAILVEILTTAI